MGMVSKKSWELTENHLIRDYLLFFHSVLDIL